jgi:ABC-2 type transport system permease protein
MRTIITITKKELKSYFFSPIAYIYLVVYLMFMGVWFFFINNFFIQEQATMRGYFGPLPIVFLFFIPAITMRLWAEEKRAGTIELLLTLPIKDHEVVLAKWLASFLFLSLSILLSATIPFSIKVFAGGNLDLGVIVASYLGAILMGGAYLAIGLFISFLTENQIIAFILSVVSIFALWVVGEVIMILPVAAAPVAEFLGLGNHYESIGRGVLDSRDLIYYASVIGFFLYLNVQFIAARRWRS